jgi:hypothetical protein
MVIKIDKKKATTTDPNIAPDTSIMSIFLSLVVLFVLFLERKANQNFCKMTCRYTTFSIHREAHIIIFDGMNR